MEPDLEDLLRAVRDEQQGAWPRLAPVLDARLKRFFRRWFGEADAEELSQTTVAAIMHKLPGFTPSKTLSGWVYGAARNIAFRRLRTRYSDAGIQALLAQVDPTAQTSPNSWLYKRELLALLREEIEQMPPHYRRAIELELDGCGIKTHARREHITDVSAATRRHRAHKWLRARIEARHRALSASPSPT